MILLHGTKLIKQYTLQDSRGFIPLEKLGQKEGFYGGRVTQFARTDKKGLYLCIGKDNKEVIDIYIDEKCIDEFTNKELEQILLNHRIQPPSRATKEELIKLINQKCVIGGK